MSATAVVTVVHRRSEHLARHRESLAASTTDAFEHVVVAMDDPALVASGGADAALPRAPAVVLLSCEDIRQLCAFSFLRPLRL